MISEGHKDRPYKDISRKRVHATSLNTYICLTYVWSPSSTPITLFNFTLFVGSYEGVVLSILTNGIFKTLI